MRSRVVRDLLIAHALALVAALASCLQTGDPAPDAVSLDGWAEGGWGCDSETCQDDSWCNGREGCDPWGTCVPGPPVNCDDGDPVTRDRCDEAADECRHDQPCCDAESCQDNLWCNGRETCDGWCAPGRPVYCNDGDPVTRDWCDEAVDACSESCGCASLYCQDGLWCNGREEINSSDECEPGPEVNCNDGDPATVDWCDEAADMCRHDRSCSAADDCDDGDTCTQERCVGGRCLRCGHAAVADGLRCSSTRVCGGTCVAGICRGPVPADCDDGNSCTIDSCDRAAGKCAREPAADGLPCDDRDPRTTGERCSAGRCLGA